MSELKPCPFCAHDVYMPLDENNEIITAIVCDWCMAYVTFCDALTVDETAQKWNKRVEEK